ncbi:MAG: hypothetical protein HUJ26_23415 [Planctomycetaceae bacterium]|nr:hypothetical protein [Planctomycetaceae bacterium]
MSLELHAMKHLSSALLLVSLIGVTSGCSQQSGVGSDPTYERQVEDFDRQTAETDKQLQRTSKQLDETDRQLERSSLQSERFEKLLDKWEQQAERQDRIFDALERFLDTRMPETSGVPAPDDAE